MVEEELSQHGGCSQLSRRVLSWYRLLPDLQKSFGRSDVFLKMGHLFLEQAPHDGHLILGGPAAGHQGKGIAHLLVRTHAAFAKHPAGHMTRGFNHLGIVQQHQRLQRCARGLSPDDAVAAVGCIQRHHGRWGHGPFPIGVEAAPIELVALAQLIVTATHGHLPETVRMIRLHARSTHLVDHQAAREECLIAQHFR